MAFKAEIARCYDSWGSPISPGRGLAKPVLFINYRGLTVIALRSLKNALYGKPTRYSSSPKLSATLRPGESQDGNSGSKQNGSVDQSS